MHYLCLFFFTPFQLQIETLEETADTTKKLSNSKLNLLPPTQSPVAMNIKLVHYQTALLMSCFQPDPPHLDPRKVNLTSF